MKLIVVSLLLLVIASGNFENETQFNNGNTTVAKNKSTSSLSRRIVSITNNQFIENAIDNDLQLRNFDSICRSFNKRTKIVKNRYSDGFDTISNYFKNSDTIVIYKA